MAHSAHTVRVSDSILPYFPRPVAPIVRSPSAVKGVKDLTFSTVMFGGHDKASFGMSGDINILATYRDMLGKDVAIFDGLGVQVWEGFVNSMSVRHGRGEYKAGPIMDIVNRAKMRYTTPRFNTNPPTGGIEMETIFFDASMAAGILSQQIFGVMSEIIIPPRPLTTYEANELGAELASSLSMPAASISIVESEGRVTEAKFECLGYFHLMKKIVVDYYGYDGTAPPQPAWEVLAHPFIVNANGFYNVTGIVPSDGPSLRLFNDAAESAHAFLETQNSIVGSYRNTQYMVGVYNNRSVHVRRVIRPDRPDVLVSVRSGIRGMIEGGGATIMPGMYAAITDVPFALHPTESPGFIIDNIEFSGGNLALNAGTFSALDEALRQRGV